MQSKMPTGTDLLAKLLDLLAEQEGVKITYTIGKEVHNYERTESHR